MTVKSIKQVISVAVVFRSGTFVEDRLSLTKAAMKIHVTFLLLFTFFIARAQEHGRGKKGQVLLTLYDKQDRIYGASWADKESIIYFYPYLMDKPYVDSTTNRYASNDIIELYHKDPPVIIRRSIDPAEMVPVTTKDNPDNFCFIVDLRTMTQAEQDSCQAFLEYFHEHKLKEEKLHVLYMGKDNVFYRSYVTYDRVPVLGNDPQWYPRKRGDNILYADMARHIWKTVEGTDGEFHDVVSSTMVPAYGKTVYIYLGRTDDFRSPGEEMTNLNTVYRSRHTYMHYIDLSEGDSLTPFRQTAKLAGGYGMKFSWGKEVLTKKIMNDLVVHYLWKEAGVEDTYNSSETHTTAPAPQKPKPSIPSIPKPVVLSEPVKKPGSVLQK
jgi:hypothetical protein